MTSGWCWVHTGESCLLSPELRHCVSTEMVIPLLQATFVSPLLPYLALQMYFLIYSESVARMIFTKCKRE